MLASKLKAAGKPLTAKYDLIIFDCDGTLVNSEYLNLYAVAELLQECGLKQYTRENVSEYFAGVRFSAMIKRISQETGHVFPDDISKRFVQRVRDLAPKYIRKIDGAADVVRTAQSMAQTYVVSNGERGNVISSLEFAGLKTFFPDDIIISGNMAVNPKPAPDLYLLASERTGISPSRALVMEDTISGATAGLAAGMEVWGFCGTHHQPEAQSKKLLDLGVSRTFYNMHDVENAMNEAAIKKAA